MELPSGVEPDHLVVVTFDGVRGGFSTVYHVCFNEITSVKMVHVWIMSPCLTMIYYRVSSLFC